MTSVDWHDFERMIPIGIVASSGTPIYYSEFPGLQPENNGKVVQFFPTPTTNFSGNTFVVHYKKKHVDMVADTELQNVIPEQYQYAITQAVLEKIFDALDNPKSQLVQAKKEELIRKMRQWSENQPNKMPHWMDFNYNSLSSRLYDNSQNIYLPGN
jgi:hypothetical protein